MRKEIRFAGFGGQGVVLAGYVLGKALSLYDGFEVVMTQAYGPEARGGASSANLVVSDKPIAYPFVQRPDILVALSQEAYSKFRPTAASKAMILIDEDLIQTTVDEDHYLIPATRLAEELGRRIVANVVMVGFFTAVTGVVSREAIEKAIESSVKAKTIGLNLEAFNAGYAHLTINKKLETENQNLKTVIQGKIS
jgi:2-oxoglutarate ferredoxin oxidoreductase subunit gamma